MNAFAAVALFAPIEVGAAIPRSAWPVHLTVVSNFTAEASAERVIAVVRDALTDTPPAEARIAGRAMFGPAADIPVQLVEPGPFPDVHEALAEAVERLPGFVADEPDYWRDGYRAHITLRAGESLREGDAWPVRCFAAVQLTEEYGMIIDVVNVGCG